MLKKIVLTTLIGICFAPKTFTFSEYASKAEQEYKKGNKESASTLLQRGLNSATVMLEFSSVASIASKTGNKELARSALEKGIDKFNLYSDLTYLATVAHKLGFNNLSTQALQKAFNLVFKTNNDHYINPIIVTAHKLGNRDFVNAAFKRIFDLAKSPKDWTPYHYYGTYLDLAKTAHEVKVPAYMDMALSEALSLGHQPFGYEDIAKVASELGNKAIAEKAKQNT